MSDRKVLIISGIILISLICGCSESREDPTPKIIFEDNFNKSTLNNNWTITRKGDFKESTIDIHNHRLRLRANTLQTDDNTVKFHGMRTTRKLNFTKKLNISFDIDWNNQSNGCYLTAAVYLCPTATDSNPGDENNWLKFEYIGVPPGHNARCLISTKINGRMKQLYTEGWPKNKIGRHISNQHITIILNNESFKIFENNKEIYKSSTHDLTFTSAYLYLQMSSHSNYPTREIYFDNILVKPA